MITRREILKGIVGAGIAAIGGCTSARTNLVLEENAKSGTSDWILTNTRVDPEYPLPFPMDRRLLLQDQRPQPGRRSSSR